MSWECPYCYKPATIQNCDIGTDWAIVRQRKTAEGWVGFLLNWIVCPAPGCQKITVLFSKYTAPEQFGYAEGRFQGRDVKVVHHQRLFPRGSAKPLPDYVPEQIAQDYQEACLC